MFIICFLGNFLKIFGHFQRDFVSDSQKNQLSDTLNQRFLMTYTSLILVCVDTDGRPLNQRFLMTYSSLIFYMRGMSHTAIEDKL